MYTGKIIKIGSVELTEDEAQRYYEEGRYIVTYSKIYKLVKTDRNPEIHGKVIYTSKGMTLRGRYFAMTADTVNNLVGSKIA